MNEKHLIASAQAGDTRAFDQLMLQHQSFVRNFIAQRGDYGADLDDIVQATFFRAYKAVKTFRGDCAFSSWLCKLAITETIRMKKRAAERPQNKLQLPDDHADYDSQDDDPLDMLQAKQVLERLRYAVERLDDKQKAAYKMRYFERLDYQSIAKNLNITRAGVNSLLRNGEKKVSDYMRRHSDAKEFSATFTVRK